LGVRRCSSSRRVASSTGWQSRGRRLACLLCPRTSARARRARPVFVSPRTPPRRRAEAATRRIPRRPPRPLVSPRRTARSSRVARARARRRSPPSARRPPGRTPRRTPPPRGCTANPTGRSPLDAPRASLTSSPRAKSGRTSCTTPGRTAVTKTPPRGGVFATAWAYSTPNTGARGRGRGERTARVLRRPRVVDSSTTTARRNASRALPVWSSQGVSAKHRLGTRDASGRIVDRGRSERDRSDGRPRAPFQRPRSSTRRRVREYPSEGEFSRRRLSSRVRVAISYT